MKKLLAVLAVLFCLTGCMANYDYGADFIDTHGYNYAIIKMPDGTILEGEIQSWRDFEGEQLEVKIDGVIYLTNSFNCVLIYK